MEAPQQETGILACGFRHLDGGTEACLAVFDHPSNLRHPAPSFIVLNEALPFVYYSPALLFRAPHTLPSGKSLALRYGIGVYPGRLDKDRLNGAWCQFVTGGRHEK